MRALADSALESGSRCRPPSTIRAAEFYTIDQEEREALSARFAELFYESLPARATRDARSSARRFLDARDQSPCRLGSSPARERSCFTAASTRSSRSSTR